MRGSFLFLLGLVTLLSPTQGVVERIQGFYERTEDLRGKFHQRVELAMGQIQEASGAFYLRRPGMMRWEYEHPERRLLVTNGSTVWAYTPLDKQVIIQDLQEAVSSIPFDFLMGAGKLTEQFHIREVMAATHRYRLTLIPRRADPVLRQMEMEVEAGTLHIVHLILLDHYENRTVMQFSELQVNTGLVPHLFSFTPPPGVEVLRGQELYPR
jgi:outer membrane lipoprotein carrier protein